MSDYEELNKKGNPVRHTRVNLPYGRTHKKEIAKGMDDDIKYKFFQRIMAKKCGDFSVSAVGANTPFLTTRHKIGQAHIFWQKVQ